MDISLSYGPYENGYVESSELQVSVWQALFSHLALDSIVKGDRIMRTVAANIWYVFWCEKLVL